MFGNILRCTVLLVIFLRIVRGSPVAGRSEDSIRRAKSDEILKYMNTSVDPCEDFYEFVCGNYGEINAASENKPKTSLLQTLVSEMAHKTKALLVADDAADTEIDKKVKHFYRSCMNLSSMANGTVDKLKEIAAEFGQMPVLVGDAWQEQHFDWARTVGNIAHKLGISILTEYGVGIDFADNSVNRLYISQQPFPMKVRALYLDKNYAAYAHGYTMNIAGKLKDILGLEDKLAQQTAAEIVDFETSLATALFDGQAGGQLSDIYKLRSLDAAQHKYSPDMDVIQQATLALGPLPSDLKVYVQEDYQQHMLKVLQKAPRKIVANYIFYRLLDNFMFYVPETEKGLQDKCIRTMKPYFLKNLENMAYRTYNLKDTEAAIGDMWHNIKSAFHKSLESEQLSWIQADTRKYAVEKLSAMKVEIMSYEQHNFTKSFGQLNLDSRDYFGNLREMLSAKAQQSRSVINEPPQPIDAGEKLTSLPVNILLENAVKIPVTLLQPYYTWSSSFPNYFNFATLGGLLSHELLHGFDDTGRTYDAQGNNRVWWDNESAAEFDARTKCFMHQYKQYVFGGQHLPELTNQGENIADNGGVRLAYQAYLNWLQNAVVANRKLDQETLPGLDYNNRQMFFISYGQFWCSDSYSGYQRAMTSSDLHAPEKFRVIGPLSNFGEFSKEFNCPRGSGMNPAKKCQIY